MRLDTHISGRVAELKAEEWFVSRGYPVSVPTTEERYDFIVDTGDELLRVQVKCAFEEERYGNQKIAAEFRAGVDNKEYAVDDLDIFVVYNPVHEELYCLDYNEAPSNTRRNRENWLPHLIEEYF